MKAFLRQSEKSTSDVAGDAVMAPAGSMALEKALTDRRTMT
ncbi:MAG: hypothetical protein U0441_21130 [Polyangiaceae bacterium]